MRDTASKMPARIWADLNSPALSRSQDLAGGFDSAMPYYRADIVERLAEALQDIYLTMPKSREREVVRDALTSYREATNDE